MSLTGRVLLGVDTIPDMFRTLTNVAGTMAVATILSRRKATPPPASTVEAMVAGGAAPR